MSDLHLITPDATGLRLYRIDRHDNLIACEAVRLAGPGAVKRAILLARVSGRAEVGGDIKDHFADVLDANQDIIETVALDARSYGALKNKWMRCRLEQAAQGGAS